MFPRKVGSPRVGREDRNAPEGLEEPAEERLHSLLEQTPLDEQARDRIRQRIAADFRKTRGRS